MSWTQQEAINLCVEIESICPKFGCHVALTGGCLYRAGERKDCDIVFYRIRESIIDTDELWEALRKIGFDMKDGGGWIFKAEYRGKKVDCFFPEEEWGGEEYPRADESDKDCPRDLLF